MEAAGRSWEAAAVRKGSFTGTEVAEDADVEAVRFRLGWLGWGRRDTDWRITRVLARSSGGRLSRAAGWRAMMRQAASREAPASGLSPRSA